jgi:hypothetical protein
MEIALLRGDNYIMMSATGDKRNDVSATNIAQLCVSIFGLRCKKFMMKNLFGIDDCKSRQGNNFDLTNTSL